MYDYLERKITDLCGVIGVYFGITFYISTRQEAENKILAEILRLERQSMLVRASGDSYAKLLHQMRSQIDEQDKIISQHRQDFFNLNSVELVLLASAVILCTSHNVLHAYIPAPNL